MNILPKILGIILPIIVVVLAGYGLLSENYKAMPYLMFFIEAMFLVIGIAEIKEKLNKLTIPSISVSVFIFYVSVQGFLLK